MDLETIRQEARAVAEELITTAQMKPGQILVVGCSSSEIHNSKLGTDSSQEIGQAVFEALYACTKEHGLYLAAQCCEHLNRAVVLERAAAEKYGYEPVCAVPWLHGGGYAEIAHTLVNALAITSGIVCDGAKPSCAEPPYAKPKVHTWLAPPMAVLSDGKRLRDMS